MICQVISTCNHHDTTTSSSYSITSSASMRRQTPVPPSRVHSQTYHKVDVMELEPLILSVDIFDIRVATIGLCLVILGLRFCQSDVQNGRDDRGNDEPEFPPDH
jgi:hypothetical protein